MIKNSASISTRLKAHIKSEIYFYLALLFILIIGLAAGITSVNSLDDPQRGLHMSKSFAYIAQYGYEFWPCFIRSFCINTIIFGLVMLSGIWTAGILTCAAGVLIKGFLVGYSLQSFIVSFSTKSPLFIICTFLLAWLPQTVLILYISAVSLREWFTRAAFMFNKRRTAPVNPDYLLRMAKMGIPLALCIILEAAICPSVNLSIFKFLNLN